MEVNYLVTYYNRALKENHSKQFNNLEEAKVFATTIKTLFEIENIKLIQQTFIEV